MLTCSRSYPTLDIRPFIGKDQIARLNRNFKSFGIRFKNSANRLLEAAIRFDSIRNFGDSIHPNARFMSKRDAFKILA